LPLLVVRLRRMEMNDERIIEVIAESLFGGPALFHDATPTVKRKLMRASGILFHLRAAGFDVYRPEGCPLVDYWQDTPDDKVALVDGDGRRIYGAGIPDGRYRLVPVETPTTAFSPPGPARC